MLVGVVSRSNVLPSLRSSLSLPRTTPFPRHSTHASEVNKTSVATPLRANLSGDSDGKRE